MNVRVELFNGKGGLIQGCIQRIDRTGLDFVAQEDPILVLPQTTQWHVFAAFGKCLVFEIMSMDFFKVLGGFFFFSFFVHVKTYFCLGTLKGGRADWLVEKCTVCVIFIHGYYQFRTLNCFLAVLVS